MKDSYFYLQYCLTRTKYGEGRISIYEDCASLHPGMFMAEHNFLDDRRSLFACYPLSHAYVTKKGNMQYLYTLGISGQVAQNKTYTYGSFIHDNPDYWRGFDSDSTYRDSYIPDFYAVINQLLELSVVGDVDVGRIIQPLGSGFSTLLQRIHNNGH